MIAYMDASVLVPLFLCDTLSDRAQAVVENYRPQALASDLAAAELASVLARRVRAQVNTQAEVDQTAPSPASPIDATAPPGVYTRV